MTAWTDFVSKIYHEGHNKNSSYSFKQALKDASKRKGEMGSMSKSNKSKSHKSKSHKNMKNKSQMKKSKRGGTRKR